MINIRHRFNRSASIAFSRIIAALVLCGLFTPVNAQYEHLDQLPDLGSNAANFLSERDAEQLGLSFIRQTRAQMDYISDPELTDYINRLGQSLVAASDYPNRSFHFYLINNPVINAFAVPGGHIVLNTGILIKSKNESELASVIAHEIAHITQRHIARKLESSRYDSIIALGALLGAAVAGGSDGAQAAYSVANASILERQLSYSRSFEGEADSLGIRLLSKAQYSPMAMPAFFKRLLSESRISESHAPEFLRSHPLTINRIAETSERAKGYPDNYSGDNAEFKLMQTKALASYSRNAKQSSDQFESQIKSGDDSLTTRYGYALALSKNSQFDQAREQIKSLLKQHPDNVSIRLLQADNELEAKHLTLGLAQLDDIYQEQSALGNRLIDLYYANALVLTNKPKQAIPVLRAGIINNPDEPLFHILLARAYGETDQMMQSFQSRAEFHFMRGNYKFALLQLEKAEELASSSYDKARIQARMEDVQTQINELEKLT